MITSSLNTAAPVRSLGIAWTSFPIRMGGSVQAIARNAAALPAEEFIPLCHSFGAQGCQMGFSQLVSDEAAYLRRIRRLLEERNMFLELGIDARLLSDEAAYARMAAAARELGVSRLRVACLSGRRYENFHALSQWQEFANNWQQTLRRAAPLIEKHRLLVGIENHKDWLADELIELLRHADSQYLGVCVDFGNNLALLEDSVEVATKLAPFVVTTHLKDMALRPDADGFQLSEVPLGDGMLPLGKLADTLRRARRDVHFCLEMITRDPLKVPYLTDHYWATYTQRDTQRIEKFRAAVLSRASAKPLPVTSGLSREQLLEAENNNLRRSMDYARRVLKL